MDKQKIVLPKLIDAIANDAVRTLQGFGINIAHTTAMQIKVNKPV